MGTDEAGAILSRNGRFVMPTRWLCVAAAVAGLVLVPAGVSGGIPDRVVSYHDRVGDVRGGPGPDIATVSGWERDGRVSFRVTFTRTPPLAFSTTQRFTDMLLVSIWTSGNTKQPRYWLGVHGVDLKRVGLVDAVTRKIAWLGPAVVSGKSVTLSVDARRIGKPRTIRFSVAAGRERSEGTGTRGGGDYAPDKGTLAMSLP
jgi:hypothetical protein